MESLFGWIWGKVWLPYLCPVSGLPLKLMSSQGHRAEVTSALSIQTGPVALGLCYPPANPVAT